MKVIIFHKFESEKLKFKMLLFPVLGLHTLIPRPLLRCLIRVWNFPGANAIWPVLTVDYFSLPCTRIMPLCANWGLVWHPVGRVYMPASFVLGLATGHAVVSQIWGDRILSMIKQRL